MRKKMEEPHEYLPRARRRWRQERSNGQAAMRKRGERGGRPDAGEDDTPARDAKYGNTTRGYTTRRRSTGRSKIRRFD